MEPDIAFIARLIGDHARARMLTALMGGKALTATELALEAEITSQTASSHLAKLVAGDILRMRKQGRHKYFQLSGQHIAQLLEQLLTISANFPTSTISTGPSDQRLRKARICYDHLAGEAGVALYDALSDNGYIIAQASDTLLTAQGQTFFTNLGADFNALNKNKRPLCKACLDWSERRDHLAGSLGQWIINDILARKWAEKDLDSRAITFSKQGMVFFIKHYQLSSRLLSA
ncbi:transcriptional regulator [Thalassotalea insulae]|uniref:Transcriptional regulator n=1 Tax=Thalassotalea insulae TaxID=2056778 RepID=A0ABQ6GN98_9GAMM|nr:winged helix-turn-helix domain-containing protein [Thalassotalea insulae]GLX77351.1 transcriptional regulator [Thalassotalea insulae]